MEKTDQEWRDQLSAQEYQITRCGATEAAFTGPYWDCKDEGVYHCKCCGTALFHSDTKYDSGTGWPSFYAPISPDAVAEKRDTSHGMVRTESLCANCDAHLGHVFPDGPQPTGLRYCMNGHALDLKKT